MISRTFDLRSDNGISAAKLLFGYGQARGPSARLAAQMSIQHIRTHPNFIGEPMSMHIMQALFTIPIVAERIGDSSHEDLMVAHVVRQGVNATYMLPTHTRICRDGLEDLRLEVGTTRCQLSGHDCVLAVLRC